MTQPEGGASPTFMSDVRAMGGVNVDELSIRLIVNGNSPQGVRITDIHPVSQTRSAPLGGTLFYLPPQAGNATIKMMFDLDEVVPIARDIAQLPCHDVTQGDTVRCVVTDDPYPQQPLTAYVGGAVSPGESFFDNESISLADHEQQVLYIRAQVTHFSATFKLEVDYTVGNDSGDVHKVIVSDQGQPFRVTGMPSGTGSGTVSYQAAFNLQENFSLCPVADPRSIPMAGAAQIACKS